MVDRKLLSVYTASYEYLLINNGLITLLLNALGINSLKQKESSMNLQHHIEQAYQTFLGQLQDTQVLLLHPESLYRSVLVARLINSPDHNVFYYALGPDDIELPSFLYSIIHDLAVQHPTFGRHLNMLPQVT